LGWKICVTVLSERELDIMRKKRRGWSWATLLILVFGNGLKPTRFEN